MNVLRYVNKTGTFTLKHIILMQKIDINPSCLDPSWREGLANVSFLYIYYTIKESRAHYKHLHIHFYFRTFSLIIFLTFTFPLFRSSIFQYWSIFLSSYISLKLKLKCTYFGLSTTVIFLPLGCCLFFFRYSLSTADNTNEGKDIFECQIQA